MTYTSKASHIKNRPDFTSSFFAHVLSPEAITALFEGRMDPKVGRYFFCICKPMDVLNFQDKSYCRIQANPFDGTQQLHPFMILVEVLKVLSFFLNKVLFVQDFFSGHRDHMLSLLGD